MAEAFVRSLQATATSVVATERKDAAMPLAPPAPAVARPRAGHGPDIADLEAHRGRVRARCLQVLGPAGDVDDAVQETLVRAWRTADRFEGRSTVASWLYRIATNVCLDMLRSPQRRARPGGLDPGDVRARAPDRGHGPAAAAEERDAVRRALAVALGRLPARQRATLVLRDAFGWPAADVADLLGTSLAGVHSAHQRARATVLSLAPTAGPGPTNGRASRVDPTVLAHCLDAFARHDAPAVADLLRHG